MKKLALLFLSSLLLVNSLFLPLTALAAPAVNPDPDAEATTGSTTSTSSWYKSEFKDWYAKVYDTKNPSEIYGERYTAAQVEWIIYGLFAFILNHVSDQSTSSACIGGDTEACSQAIQEAIQRLQDLIKTPPPEGKANEQSFFEMIFSERSFSGISYTKDKINSFRVVPEAKAQNKGFGFNAFDPVQGLWKASRNIAYSFAVLATIILAFMIMFRVKISPQVVISAQSAIPKVVSALVFVTFSYAIAGFLVDLMYVVIGIISLAFSQYLGQGTIISIFRIMTDGLLYLGFLGNIFFYSILFFIVLIFVLFIGSGALVVNIMLTTTGILPIIFLLTIIIVAIMIIFMIFKILWLLLKTVAQIYLLVVVGPIQIMMGTVVQSMNVGTWIKSLVSHLMVYPVVGTLFMLSFIFLFYSFGLGLGNLLGMSLTNTLFRAIFGTDLPFPTASWSPPLTLGETYMPLIFLGISFVILTLIPKTAEIIQGFISGKPFAYGSAIGEAFGPIKAGARFGLGYWGGRESEEGQEEYKVAGDDRGKEKEARRKIRRGEFLKTAGSMIR